MHIDQYENAEGTNENLNNDNGNKSEQVSEEDRYIKSEIPNENTDNDTRNHLIAVSYIRSLPKQMHDNVTEEHVKEIINGYNLTKTSVD